MRRAPPASLRSALFRVKKHLAPADTSGLEDVLGRGSEAPSDGTSLSLMTAQLSGGSTHAEKEAMESADRIRPSRAPHMRYKYMLSNGVHAVNKASEYFLRVAKQTDGDLFRAVACERAFICESRRILFTPPAPSGKGLAPPTIRPEGLAQTFGVIRTLFRMAKDAARIEAPFLRVSVLVLGIG